MSKTVRYKLNAVEQRYIQGTLNSIRGAGIETGSLEQVAKNSLMEFCVGVNKRIKEALARQQAEAAEEAVGGTETGTEDTEGTGGETGEGGTTDPTPLADEETTPDTDEGPTVS